MQKKVIIVGGGVSGMSAGIYLCRNGYDVTIYEKHILAGGECTGWKRKGIYIDGCAHWIVGTKDGSDVNLLWKEVGAIQPDTAIHENEYFAKYYVNGEVVTFYSDLDRLKNELLRVAPEDKKQIHSLIKTIRHYSYVIIPNKRPLDYNNIFQWIDLGIRMAPMALAYLSAKRTGMKDIVAKCKSPILKEVLSRIVHPRFNVHAFAYMMQALSEKDAGLIQGGSSTFSKNIEKTYRSLGGKFVFNKTVKRIVIEERKATGIELSDGTIVNGDFVVASCDAHHLFYDLLEDQHTPKFFSDRFEHPEDNPLIQSIFLAYSVPLEKAKLLPRKMDYSLSGLSIGPFEFSHLVVLNHAFDEDQNGEKACLVVLNDVDDQVYEYLKGLSKEEYQAEKKRLLEAFKKELSKDLGIVEEEIDPLDMATPLTYERYCNAYHGSYQAFVTTKKAGALMHKGILKGVKNFYFSGQWIMPPGGLPVAVFSAKMAAVRLVHDDKKKFKAI